MNNSDKLSVKEILEKEDIRKYKIPIWEMSEYQLRRRFSAESSGRPIATRIVKNIIWQVYRLIKAGLHAPIYGNLRSFWYMRVKLPLGKVGLLDEPTDHYQTLIRAFSELVRDYRLFKYEEFGFIDDNWENRRIGTENAHVIIFSEKSGFFYYLRKLHKEYDVTVTSLGGNASVLSMEYMVKHIRERTPAEQTFYAFSIVDYDPSGWYISSDFRELLLEQGLQEVDVRDMVRLSEYTPEEIEIYRYKLSNSGSARTINRKWLAATGGVQGKLYGIEADSMPKDRLMKALRGEMEKLRESGLMK